MALRSLKHRVSALSDSLFRRQSSAPSHKSTGPISPALVGVADDRRPEARGGTAPGGQVLREWLTYLSYVTTINDTPYTVETIANLPLTYYGPSIPLGDGWTYGGLTSPTESIEFIPQPTGVPSGSEIVPDESQTAATPAEDITSMPSSAIPPATTSASGSPSPPSASSVATSTQTSSTSASSTPSSLMPSTLSSLSAPTSASSSMNEPRPSSTSDPSSTPEEGRNILTPLLATLVPLGITVLIVLFFFCVYHKNRHSRDSGFFGALRKPFRSIPPPAPEQKSKEPAAPASPGARSPDEKSALLPGFTAQHHRSSSTLSAPEVDDELRALVKTNQSLLQRLTLGIGWLTPSSSTSALSTRAGTKDRKASGNTLEKGGGGRRIFSSEASAIAAGVLGWGKKGKGNKTPSTTSSGNGGYERVLEDDQLFFRTPKTQSSTGSRSRTGSATGIPSIPTTVGTGNSNRHSGQRSSYDPQLPVPEEGDPNLHKQGPSTFSVGVPVTPGTEARNLDLDPNVEVDGERPESARWRVGGERMRFPVPPGSGLRSGLGTFGERRGEGPSTVEGRKRESYMSGETAYYSAVSQSSNPDDHDPAPALGFTGTGSGVPIPRDSEEYRHASVSAFGSHPPTPTRPARSTDHAPSPYTVQSQSRETSPVRAGTVLAAPSPARTREWGVRMSRLFTSTPTPEPEPGLGSGTGGSGESKEKRRSYAGQPIIDESLRSPQSTRGIGEFGEPLRKGALVAPRVISSTRTPPSSESGSLHLTPLGSAAPSHSSSSHYSHATSKSGSSHGGDASEASHEQVLRGQRSKGMLVRASTIGGMGLTPTGAGAARGSDMGTIVGTETTASGDGGSVEVVKGEMDGKRWIGRWR